MVKGANKKIPEIVEVPVKSGGVSTFTVLFLFALVVVGCGVGFQFLIEQLEANNASLLGSIESLKEELTSVKESYASINFENEIAAIGQMKEDLQQTRLQMNTEADKVSQVKAGLAVVKTNLEGMSKDVHEVRESSKAADEKSNNVATEIGALKGSVSKLESEASEAKSANDDKLAQAQAALSAEVGSTTERITAAETALASQIQSSTQQAVEAKQLAEESKKAAAEGQAALSVKIQDGLELVSQNVAELLDARKNDAAAQADIAAQVAAAVEGAVSKSDVEAIAGEIAELKSGLAEVAKEGGDHGKSLSEAVRSFESKVNRLNANIKMISNEVNGIREVVTNVVADNEEATEAPPTV